MQKDLISSLFLAGSNIEYQTIWILNLDFLINSWNSNHSWNFVKIEDMTKFLLEYFSSISDSYNFYKFLYDT